MGVVAAIHKNPQYYEHPNKFMPERFFGRDEANPHAYMAFGGGPRLCIGNNQTFWLVIVIYKNQGQKADFYRPDLNLRKQLTMKKHF